MLRILQFIFDIVIAKGSLSKILKDRWYIVPVILLLSIVIYRAFSDGPSGMAGLSRALRMLFFN